MNRSVSGARQDSTLGAADLGLSFGKRDKNLVVSRLATSSPLAEFGFRRGDSIYLVNGMRVNTQTTFMRRLFDEEFRDATVNVVVYRDGMYQTIHVEPGEVATQVARSDVPRNAAVTSQPSGTSRVQMLRPDYENRDANQLPRR